MTGDPQELVSRILLAASQSAGGSAVPEYGTGTVPAAVAAWLRITVENHQRTLLGACARCVQTIGEHWCPVPVIWPCDDVLSAKWVADLILQRTEVHE